MGGRLTHLPFVASSLALHVAPWLIVRALMTSPHVEPRTTSIAVSLVLRPVRGRLTAPHDSQSRDVAGPTKSEAAAVVSSPVLAALPSSALERVPVPEPRVPDQLRVSQGLVAVPPPSPEARVAPRSFRAVAARSSPPDSRESDDSTRAASTSDEQPSRSVFGAALPEDLRRLHVVEAIGKRVNEVAPLVLWATASRGSGELGRALVALRLSRRGYVEDVRMRHWRGDARIPLVVGNLLHLAEPFVYVGGWIEVEIVFRG